MVWFSDIRGFTSYAEQHEPEMVVAELNRILELQAEIIHEHGGIIDKFVGDEVMAHLYLLPGKALHWYKAIEC